MKYYYDPEHDALYLSLADRRATESEEVWPGVVVDFDGQGRPVGLDIDARASELADVRGLIGGREIRIAGPELTDGTAIADGADLRFRREALGLTQAEMSAALGTTANTIARWERGELRIENPLMLGLAIAQLGTGRGAGEYPEPREETRDSIRDRSMPSGATSRSTKSRPRVRPARKK